MAALDEFRITFCELLDRRHRKRQKPETYRLAAARTNVHQPGRVTANA